MRFRADAASAGACVLLACTPLAAAQAQTPAPAPEHPSGSIAYANRDIYLADPNFHRAPRGLIGDDYLRARSC